MHMPLAVLPARSVFGETAGGSAVRRQCREEIRWSESGGIAKLGFCERGAERSASGRAGGPLTAGHERMVIVADLP